MKYTITHTTSIEPPLIHVQNNGRDLVGTNWWSHHLGKNLFFLSRNADCYRLLVPPIREAEVSDMTRNVREVVISVANQLREDGFLFELMFDDHSDAPYVIHFGVRQFDILPHAKRDAVERKRFHIYVNDHGPKLVFSTDVFLRIVPRLPWLKPLKV